jgi:signal peptidase II
VDTVHVKGRWTPLWIVALVIVLDRVTKLFIQHALNSWSTISVIPGLFRIVHTENPGAAFGILAEGNSMVRAAVLIGISSMVMVFVASALWSRTSSFTGAWTRFGLALILGGAVGNLLDRLVRGTVTDFLEVYSGSWSFPAFNVADSAITVGSIILLIELLRPRRRPIHPHVSETN